MESARLKQAKTDRKVAMGERNGICNLDGIYNNICSNPSFGGDDTDIRSYVGIGIEF